MRQLLWDPYSPASIAAWSFLLMFFRMGMAKTRVSTSARAWTAAKAGTTSIPPPT